MHVLQKGFGVKDASPFIMQQGPTPQAPGMQQIGGPPPGQEQQGPPPDQGQDQMPPDQMAGGPPGLPPGGPPQAPQGPPPDAKNLTPPQQPPGPMGDIPPEMLMAMLGSNGAV
jgi:hypothetical protein